MSELTDAERAELDRAVRALRDELEAALGAGDARTSTVELDQTAVGRVSRVDALQAQQMAQAERRRAELRLTQLRRALGALEEGTFGACARCGEEIGVQRLRARPETPFCVACATALGA